MRVDALAVGDADHLQQLDGAGFDVLLALALAVVEGDDLVHLMRRCGTPGSGLVMGSWKIMET